MLRALPLHFIQEMSLCDLVKGSFTTSLCVIVVFQTNVSFSELILSQVDGLVDQASGVGRSHDLSAELENPGSTQVPHAPRLGDGVQVLADADVALVTALDRRDIGCARDGVVILGRGANRAPLPCLGDVHTIVSFGLISSCVTCAVGELPTASSLSGARVYCGY